MDSAAPAPVAEPLRSPRLVAAVLALPASAYVVWAVVPWLRGTLVGPDGGNTVAFLTTGVLFLGAAVGLAASGAALVRLRRGGARVLPWVGLTVASTAVLAWLVSPAGLALTTAALD